MKKFSYKIPMIHDLKSDDNPKHYDLSVRYVCAVWKCKKVNRQNMRFLGTERSNFFHSLDRQHESD
jgi:hypothetical protein